MKLECLLTLYATLAEIDEQQHYFMLLSYL